MSDRIHGLAQLLPDKTSLEECRLEELQHITKRFPFFAPAQFLLVQKLKETGSPDYEAQHRKAVLYFHEPLLFDYLISADKFNMDEAAAGAEKNAGALAFEPWAEEQSLAEADTEISTSFPVDAKAGLQTINEEAIDRETRLQQNSNSGLTTELPAPPPAQTLTEEQLLLTEPDTVKETETIEPPEPAVLPVLPLQEKHKDFGDADGPETRQAEREAAASVVAAPSAVVPVLEEPLSADHVAAGLADTIPAETTVKEVQQQTKSVTPPAFEPYHTVDYFASQGIKITSDTLPKDKLSKQLRSFTEWLKVMKRLPATEMEATPQTSAEKSVESLASHSVIGGDVVTEAMAEVWARQGNKRKAIETYNKLSLLNPSKKAYFAAKIENLSGT